MEKYSTSNDKILSILYIDNEDYISIKSTKKPRFYEDDVDIEVVCNDKSYLVLNDSYRKSAYIELINAIKYIRDIDCGIVDAIGATHSRGGLCLQLIKTTPYEVTVHVLKFKYNTLLSKTSKKTIYSKNINISTLSKWQYQLKELLDKFNQSESIHD